VEPIKTDEFIDISLGSESKIDLKSMMLDPCSPLISPDFGKWECTTYNLNSSRCKAVCEPGYKFSGKNEFYKTCKDDWVDEGDSDGKCVPISCPAIVKPDNGLVKCEGDGTETFCIISCMAGYFLESGPETSDQVSFDTLCVKL
jgi:hypothetical protein